MSRNVHKSIFLICLFSIIPQLWAQAPAPSAHEKEEILEDVGKLLRKKALAYDINFRTWSYFLSLHEEAISNATTEAEFAGEINAALKRFEISHLALISPSQKTLLDQKRNWSIGIDGVEDEDGFFVLQTMPGSAAVAAGLDRGDLITAIDGESPVMRKMLHGEEDQVKEVTFTRNGESHTVSIKVKEHDTYHKSQLRMLDEETALITITSFAGGSYDRGEIETLFHEARNAKRIIVDLRSNLGGRISNVQHALGQVLPGNTLVMRYLNKGKMRRYLRKNGRESREELRQIPDAGKELKAFPGNSMRPPYEGELVVLVNYLNGSGGELYPAILAELHRAVVIGMVTRGAVLGSKRINISHGYQLKIPFLEVLTPNGTRLEKFGYTPHHLVSREEAVDDDGLIELARKIEVHIETAVESEE